MSVLMFGWEFPPHISGGLGTACYGLTKSLIQQKVNILFVVPKSHGDEEVALIDAGEIIIGDTTTHPTAHLVSKHGSHHAWMKKIKTDVHLSPYFSPGQTLRHTLEQWNYTDDPPAVEWVQDQATGKKGRRYHFTGNYGHHLMDEVGHYAEVAYEIAHRGDFDVIHAHDWLTFPAGIAAKDVSHKPLILHVHATEFDRAGENVDKRVYDIEKNGMEKADRIVAVSQWTKQVIHHRYHIPLNKITVVHNGVMPKSKMSFDKLPLLSSHVVTFLGRITHQKGPHYFIRAAKLVLRKFLDTHFIMAGSGDLMVPMIETVAKMRMSSHFHFTGFLKGDQVDRVWAISSVYVMPSVSEPFGIAPLEAIQSDVPVIISNQSGVAEVIPHAIKVDFWNTEALADAICHVLEHDSLSNTLKTMGRRELDKISWDRAARKIKKVYHELV